VSITPGEDGVGGLVGEVTGGDVVTGDAVLGEVVDVVVVGREVVELALGGCVMRAVGAQPTNNGAHGPRIARIVIFLMPPRRSRDRAKILAGG
jgi:hypothetical protein